VSAFRIDFLGNHLSNAIFVSWVVISSLLVFVLFPNWVTLTFLLLVWLPLSFFQKRKLKRAFVTAGTIHLEGVHVTLKGDTGLQLQGQIDPSSQLFDAFVALKIVTPKKKQWFLFLESSFDAASWSRLRSAIIDAKEN
jgi:hypothetical protein